MRDSSSMGPPRGLMRWSLRLPIWMYRAGLGGLLGERFVLINHVGRTTGRVRRVVVEVVDKNHADGTIYVVSGWGSAAQWYQNLLAKPDVTVQLGSLTVPMTGHRVDADEGMRVLLQYRDAHPLAARILGRVLGVPIDASGPDELRVLAAERLPVVELRPR